MTEIERKALALLNEVQIEMHGNPGWYEGCNRTNATPVEALCRALEQHEAFRQEVSDAVEKLLAWPSIRSQAIIASSLARFIIAKPDPLVEVCREIGLAPYRPDELRAAIEKRGGKIVWGEGE